MNGKSTHVQVSHVMPVRENIREIYGDFVKLLWLLAMSYQPKIKKNKVKKR